MTLQPLSFTISTVMQSLLTRVFRNNYFRILARKATWTEAWLSLKRAHKDKRARKHLFGLGLLLGFTIVLPIICLAYLVLLIGTGAWLFLPFVLPVIWWRNRRAKEDFAPVHIAPASDPIRSTLSPDERRSLRTYFAELALIHAVFVDRTGSERFLKEKVLPEEVEVASRRMHLELLRSTGIWERLARLDREALMMPDGHWDWARINQAALAIEPLRLLRWILRIDFYLPLVGQQLVGDFSIAHDLILTPKKVLNGNDLIDEEAMCRASQAAEQNLLRCMAETITRGYQIPANDQAVRWAKEISESLHGHQDEDLVLGSKLVSEVTREQLMWATSLAKRRTEFLRQAISAMKSGQTPAPPFACILRK